MPTKKYISTKDAVRLTGLTKQEIYDLIHEGTLRARKAPKSGWRILPEDLVALGLVKEEEMRSELPAASDSVTYITGGQHYSLVFKRMTEVKHSLSIATANLKNFYVSVEGEGEDDPLRLCEFFLSLVERGVHVRIVCMKPFGFYLYTKENCPQLLEHPLFELRCNEHNHMKVFIFDDECAYIGSANITDAAIGKRPGGSRNHEAGMLVWGRQHHSGTPDPLRESLERPRHPEAYLEALCHQSERTG